MEENKGLIGFRWYWTLKHQGDLLSRAHLPENYFKNTGEKLVNMDNHHFFAYNPYVIQAKDIHPNTLNRVQVRDIWKYRAQEIDDNDNDKNMAQQNCRWWGLKKCYLSHPRLYRFEDSITQPRNIVVHTTGQTVGGIPLHVLNHISEKYRPNYNLFQIGALTDLDINVDFDRRGCDFWESARIISEAAQMICVDSMPMWIGKCYPNVRLKIVILRNEQECENFLPTCYQNNNNHWTGWVECGHEYYNTFEEDLGATKSYLKI